MPQHGAAWADSRRKDSLYDPELAPASVTLLNRSPLWCALPALIASAQAQTQTRNEPVTARVEVTGSRLRQAAAEGALPVQVIARAEIARLGIASVEQLVSSLSANGTGADNLSANAGIQLGTTARNNNGNASANLRGLGAGSTLVLLNGRRIPTHGAKGNSADLSWIPMAAIAQVEILKDGASAIYGADAIGGVINFITRDDVQGLQTSAHIDAPEAGGGAVYSSQTLAGFGDLEQDGYYAMLALGMDRQEKLAGDQRGFSNGYQPERGLAPDTAGTPYATQVPAAGTAIGAAFSLPGSGNQAYNRANRLAFTGQCDAIEGMSPYASTLWGNPAAAYACAYDYGAAAVLIQPVQRAHLLGTTTVALGGGHQLSAELVGSRVDARKRFEPYQITTSASNLALARYPAGGRYYQDLSAFVPGFNPNLPIAYRWRCEDCGGRTIDTTTDGWRALIALEGPWLQTWDYRIGLAAAGSKARSELGSGYYYTDGLIAALGSGDLNLWRLPGEAQDAAGLARLAAASAAGERLFDGRSQLLSFDATISGELVDLPTGALALAAGVDLREERYAFSDGSRSTALIFQAPFDPEFPQVERRVSAVYAELNAPLAAGLEASLAGRIDRYSDFGSTRNPKLSLSYAPDERWRVRAAVGSGFRAPSFFQLYTAETESPVPGDLADPVLCPLGNVAGADLSVCAIRPNARRGGNPGLDPESSDQWSMGLVVSPTAWFDFSVDLWQIRRDQLIVELTPQEIIARYTTFPENLVRGSNGRLDGPGGYIRAGFVNAEGDRARGADVRLALRGDAAGGSWRAGLDGTWLFHHREQLFRAEPAVDTVGAWDARNLFLRWKHLAYLGYERGRGRVTLSHQYAAGYADETPLGAVPDGFDPRVKPYGVYHLALEWSAHPDVDLTFTVRNLFNQDPPFTAHNVDFAAGAGWDPRVADPRGRSYGVRVTWRFDGEK